MILSDVLVIDMLYLSVTFFDKLSQYLQSIFANSKYYKIAM